MKVLFLHMFPLFGNGSGVFLRELSNKLKDGHEIAIVAPDDHKLPGITHYKVNPPQNGVFVGNPELPGAKPFSEMSGQELGDIYSSYLWAAIHAASDFKPDVIHVFHTAFLPGVARTLKSIFGIPYIITTHGSDLHYMEKDRRFVGLVKDANQHARMITANSSFTKQWYLRMFGQSLRPKSTVVVGGVNLDHYKKDPNHIALINKLYNFTDDQKVVLFTGRLTKQKGVIHLVRAAKQIKGTVLIVGDGPERETIKQEIEKKKITNVILAGYINSNKNELYHAYYERADVYVAPSTWDEPLGLTILEAMAARTPVVATKKGGIVSIINDKVNGYLVRVRSSEEIAEKVNTLLENDKLRAKIGEKAYKTIVEKFSWDSIARRFEKVYNEAAGKSKQTDLPIESFFKQVFTA